jgi:adenylate kinase family enzyme
MQKKIHLIGGPGSGKTSAGVALAHRFGLPHLDLDEIFWEREATTFGPQTAPAVRDAALAAFIAQRAWVVEGAYVGPWLQRKLGLRPLKQHKRETLKGLWKLYQYNHGYDQTHIPEAKALLAGLGRQLPGFRAMKRDFQA